VGLVLLLPFAHLLLKALEIVDGFLLSAPVTERGERGAVRLRRTARAFEAGRRYVRVALAARDIEAYAHGAIVRHGG
jgi:hypothetical protein